MEKSKRLAVLILWLSICLSSVIAQDNRYIIHFPDKSDTPYSIANPLEYLSQKALDRRGKQGIGITEQDFPVSPKYLDSLTKYGLKAYYTSKWLNCALLQTTEAKINEITTKSFVKSIEYVAPDAKLSAIPEVYDKDYVPNPINSATTNSDTQLSQLHATRMHSAGYTGQGLWIAVLDAGFQGTDSTIVFKDLYDNDRIKETVDIVSGGNHVFRYSDHGTNVLSCIGAKYDDTLVGTAYDADFSLYVTEEPRYEDEYRVEEYNWLFAAEKADSSGVDIISSSLGYNTFEDSSMDYQITDLDGQTAVVTRAVNIAFTKGILVVVSAGNSGTDSSWEGKIVVPGDSETALTVGAIDDSNKVASFSSKGPSADGRIKPDVVALGVRTSVYHGNGNIGFNNGTSFSTPLIAGFAAAVWQYNPDLTNLELLNLIRSAGNSFDNPDNERGYGLPTFTRVTGEILEVDELLSDEINVFPNPFTDNVVHIKIPENFNSERIEFLIYASDGKLVGKRRVKNPTSNEVIDINVKSKATGVYFLTITTDTFSRKVKLIKY